MSKGTVVYAIVVTYNRLEWLKKNIQALKSQTFQINTICIVDNASTDGTKEFLKELEENDTQIKCLRLERNTGGAGGFYNGMKYALTENADWLWIMDDDCLPDSCCLENLLHDIPTKEDAIITPLAISLEDKHTQIWNNNNLDVNSGIYKAPTAPFTGLFTSHKVVSKIGLPNKDFFIYADDVEYSLRAIENGCTLYVSTNATLYHPYKTIDLLKTKFFQLPLYECSKLRAYYATRNNIICNKRYKVTIKPMSEHFKTLIKLIVVGKFDVAFLKLKGIRDGLLNRVFVKNL